MNNMINVLDKGYVRLVDVFGDDLNVVNCARVSFDKESTELTQKDKGLIKFLLKHGHTSPFRNQALQFEVYGPLMVARQWYKYHVASNHTEDQDGWNESSRRYITESLDFYVPGPSEWRSTPDNKKQGSGHPVDVKIGQQATSRLMAGIERQVDDYNWALDNNIAPELARVYLPAYGMYVRWRWTTSLMGLLHYLEERMASDAQSEINDYAKAVYELAKPKFAATFEVWEATHE